MPLAPPDVLLTRIARELPGYSRAFRQLGGYVLKNALNASGMGIDELAAAAGVSVAPLTVLPTSAVSTAIRRFATSYVASTRAPTHRWRNCVWDGNARSAKQELCRNRWISPLKTSVSAVSYYQATPCSMRWI